MSRSDTYSTAGCEAYVNAALVRYYLTYCQGLLSWQGNEWNWCEGLRDIPSLVWC